MWVTSYYRACLVRWGWPDKVVWVAGFGGNRAFLRRFVNSNPEDPLVGPDVIINRPTRYVGFSPPWFGFGLTPADSGIGFPCSPLTIPPAIGLWWFWRGRKAGAGFPVEVAAKP